MKPRQRPTPVTLIVGALITGCGGAGGMAPEERDAGIAFLRAGLASFRRD